MRLIPPKERYIGRLHGAHRGRYTHGEHIGRHIQGYTPTKGIQGGIYRVIHLSGPSGEAYTRCNTSQDPSGRHIPGVIPFSGPLRVGIPGLILLSGPLGEAYIPGLHLLRTPQGGIYTRFIPSQDLRRYIPGYYSPLRTSGRHIPGLIPLRYTGRHIPGLIPQGYERHNEARLIGRLCVREGQRGASYRPSLGS